MKVKPKTIALCMIVKDEAHVVERAFDSVINFITHIYVCDTGSTDGTQQLIKDYIKKHKLRGRVVNRPWVDFSHNRNEAFALAKGKCDYIMTLDADEVLIPMDEVKDKPAYDKVIKNLPEFTADMVEAYSITGTTRYTRPQFFKESVEWVWKKPLHEYAMAKNGSCSKQLLTSICNWPRPEGARSKKSRKTFRDALVLENHLIDNPDDNRSWFYLGQCYMDDNCYDRAIPAMKRALETSRWDEERYVLCLRLGRCTREVEHCKEESLGYFHQAYNECPWRAEALWELLSYYRRKDMFNLAVLYGEKALENSQDKKGSLFVEHATYDWRILDELTLAYHYSGDSRKCLKLCTRLQEAVPEKEKERLEKNLQGFRKAL